MDNKKTPRNGVFFYYISVCARFGTGGSGGTCNGGRSCFVFFFLSFGIFLTSPLFFHTVFALIQKISSKILRSEKSGVKEALADSFP